MVEGVEVTGVAMETVQDQAVAEATSRVAAAERQAAATATGRPP